MNGCLVNIGPKIFVDGEAEYRKQINNLIQQARTLDSEMKAVTASFDDNASAQEKAGAVAEVLTKQIDTQKKRISLLSDMLEKSADKYGENDTKTLRWQQAVNEANAELTLLEKELSNTVSEMSQTADAMDDLANQKALQNQLENIAQQARTLSSEMKLTEASFAGNVSAQEKAAAVAEVLNRQVDVQRQKVETLSKVLEHSTAALGENDTETLKWQQSVNEAKVELSKMESELQETQEALEETGDSLSETENGFEDAGEAASIFGDVLSANMVADFVTDCLRDLCQAVKEFTKESIEAAAKVKAANSQFEQTFGDLEDSATKALENIADETGITASRMKSSYTSIYAFAKTAGAESEDALDIASRALEAAADSAAYYDKSVEEVTESLQSFLKGNYENDAALGISATETTRNAKANEMYAVSFDKLSESQKVDVLLAMVEAGNQASGALGQAAREADSWANVTGEAEEAWKQLQATVGNPVLEAVIPIIQNITAAINEMIDASASEELTDSMEEVRETWEKAEKQFSETSREIEINDKMARAYADSLEELERAGLDTESSQQKYVNAVRALNDLYPELNLQIDEQTGLLDENSRAMLNNLESIKQKALFTATEERYTAALRAQADAQLNVQEASYALQTTQTELGTLQSLLAESTGRTVEECIKLYNSQQMVNASAHMNSDVLPGLAAAMEMASGATSGLTAEEVALVEQILALNQEETNLQTALANANAAALEQQTIVTGMEESLGLMTTNTSEAAAAQTELEVATEQVIADIQSLRSEYDEAKTAARDAVDSQIGYFDELTLKSGASAEEIIANWGSQKQAFEDYSANLQKAVDMGLDQTLVQQLSDGSEESMVILNEFVNKTDVGVDEINAAFEKMQESRETVAATMADVQTEMSKRLSEIESTASESWNEMSSIVAEEIAAMQDYIDNLKGRTVYVNVITRNSSGPEKTAATVDGSHASGLAYVPFDGYIAELHRGEMILTKAQADVMRNEEYIYIPQRLNDGYEAGEGNVTNNYGDIDIHVYQQPGEDMEDFAYRLMDMMQMDFAKKEAGIGV